MRPFSGKWFEPRGISLYLFGVIVWVKVRRCVLFWFFCTSETAWHKWKEDLTLNTKYKKMFAALLFPMWSQFQEIILPNWAYFQNWYLTYSTGTFGESSAFPLPWKLTWHLVFECFSARALVSLCLLSSSAVLLCWTPCLKGYQVCWRDSTWWPKSSICQVPLCIWVQFVLNEGLFLTLYICFQGEIDAAKAILVGCLNQDSTFSDAHLLMAQVRSSVHQNSLSNNLVQVTL